MIWDKYTFPNFTPKKFRCQCGCETDNMDEGFMTSLQRLRDLYKRPMTITSGYRCSEHPIEKRKRSPGAHNTGKAADVLVAGADAWSLMRCAAQSPEFTGIGVKQNGLIGTRFIHLDTIASGSIDWIPRPTIWSY